MASSLESLLSEGVITEIYGRLKSGKEADVYAVCYGDSVVAAKVYKDRAQRSFKSNSTYKEGRAVRNTRSQRAMDRGSKFGQEAAEDAWKSAEATALYKLHAAGVRVPTPVMFLEGVLFMELVRGADGEPAPRLIDTELSPAEARTAYLDMLSQLVRILCCDLIHGDLSPYNVLWAEAGPTIIDFPQIVSAAQNSNSETFFMRDARNILGHFAAIDRSLEARLHGDMREIWRAYVRRELSPEFLPMGRPAAPEPRQRFAAPQDRAPRPERGFDTRGPQGNRGPQQGQDRGPQGNRGPQQGQDRGPRP
ncbi:MAG TPA: RIO1 family regulatory kinase/ATPase, partial [Polyangiaceae bacterium]